MPKISVIVPVYKVEKYLNRCVDSILNQTFKDFEIILVDDGSPDNCPAICDEYAAKYDFVHVIHKENGGLSDALNCGIQYAMTTDGEWITFIDSDDYVHELYLEKLFSMTNLGTDITSFGIGKEYGYDKLKEPYGVIVDSPENLWIQGQVSVNGKTSKLYKKHLFNDIKFPKGKLFEDEYTTHRIIYKCDKIAVMNINLYYYYNNPCSIMHDKWDVTKRQNSFYSLMGAVDFYYRNNFVLSFYKQFGRLFNKFTDNIKSVENDIKAVKLFKSDFRKILRKYRKKFPISKYEDYYLYSYSVLHFRIIKLKCIIWRKISFLQKNK